MLANNRRSNLILSGGGVKGIAYIGALEALESEKWKIFNIAGVSAGAIVGSILASGYRAHSLKEILDKLSFEKIKGDDIVRRIPVVSEYIEFSQNQRLLNRENEEFFLFLERLKSGYKSDLNDLNSYDIRCSIFKKIIKLCKQGHLFDGDYLEEWMYDILRKRGVRTFADLRGGLVDKVNPRGYKMRMTAVDATRGEIVVLPDDMEFYGIHPDNLEVAKAVRMSISVPFVFKPVQIKSIGNNIKRDYYFVDGGVFDNFPFWLIDNKSIHVNWWGYSTNIPTIGMKIESKKFFQGLNPFNILKNIISSVYDIGVPKNIDFDKENIIKIDTSNISFLDFDLDQKEISYLIKNGYKSVEKFCNKNRNRAVDYRYFNIMLILVLLFIKGLF